VSANLKLIIKNKERGLSQICPTEDRKMATFRNRDGKWQARVRRQGYAAITKSFITMQDAEKWARSVELHSELTHLGV
jgi:hypothetical protein